MVSQYTSFFTVAVLRRAHQKAEIAPFTSQYRVERLMLETNYERLMLETNYERLMLETNHRMKKRVSPSRDMREQTDSAE